MDLRKAARRATVYAEIMEGREKGVTEDLIAAGEVTIDNCEVITCAGDDGASVQRWVFTIVEDKAHFYFAGTVANKVFEEMLKACEGDYTELYSWFEKNTLSVKFESGTNKKGQPCTKVKVL